MSEIPFTDNPILKTDIEDFRKEVFNDILIQTVNFSRATFQVAQEFRDRVVNDILNKYDAVKKVQFPFLSVYVLFVRLLQ